MSAEVVAHAPCPVLVVRRADAGEVVFADDGDPGLGRLLGAAPEDFAQELDRSFLWKCHDIERDDRAGAHGVDVRKGVGGRDPAEVVGAVDDRGEEVDRLREGDLIRQAVDARVVGLGRADEDVWIVDGWEEAQDLRQKLGTELARSAGAVRQKRQALFLSGGRHSRRVATGRGGGKAISRDQEVLRRTRDARSSHSWRVMTPRSINS